jgi:hypothetical protein
LSIRTNTCQPHAQGGSGVCCKRCYDRNHKLTEKYAHAHMLLLLLGCIYTYEVCLWSSKTCCHLLFSRTNLFNTLLTFSIYGVKIIDTSGSLDSLKFYVGFLLLKNTVIFPSQNWRMKTIT